MLALGDPLLIKIRVRGGAGPGDPAFGKPKFARFGQELGFEIGHAKNLP